MQRHCAAVAGTLKDVVDQAAERLQKKRKASEMATSPFASPVAAHRASADGQSPANKEQQAGDDHIDGQSHFGHFANQTSLLQC